MYRIPFVAFLYVACASWAAAAATPTKLQAVSLKLTLNPVQSTGAATSISPDNGSPYIDGQEGVCATLDTNGNLIVHLGCTSTSTPRRFVIAPMMFLANPTAGATSCSNTVPDITASNTTAYTNNVVSGAASNLAPGAAFQNMTVGNTYYIQIVIGTVFSDASQTTFRLNYDDPAVFNDGALSSAAQVVRTSQTQWIVEPIAPSSSYTGNQPNTAMLVEQTTTRNKSVSTECGFYSVPFSFVLDAK